MSYFNATTIQLKYINIDTIDNIDKHILRFWVKPQESYEKYGKIIYHIKKLIDKYNENYISIDIVLQLLKDECKESMLPSIKKYITINKNNILFESSFQIIDENNNKIFHYFECNSLNGYNKEYLKFKKNKIIKYNEEKYNNTSYSLLQISQKIKQTSFNYCTRLACKHLITMYKNINHPHINKLTRNKYKNIGKKYKKYNKKL